MYWEGPEDLGSPSKSPSSYPSSSPSARCRVRTCEDVHDEINYGFLPAILVLPSLQTSYMFPSSFLPEHPYHGPSDPRYRPECRFENSHDHRLVSPTLAFPPTAATKGHTGNSKSSRVQQTLVHFGIFTSGQSNRSNHNGPAGAATSNKIQNMDVSSPSLSLRLSPSLPLSMATIVGRLLQFTLHDLMMVVMVVMMISLHKIPQRLARENRISRVRGF